MYKLRYENIEKVIESEIEKDKLIDKGYALCEDKKKRNKKSVKTDEVAEEVDNGKTE